MKTHSAVAVTCLAALELTGAAHAQTPLDPAPTGPTLQFHVSGQVQRDSNILRASEAVSDEIGVLAAGVRLDKRYSLQHLTLEAEASRVRFREFSNLDYSTLTYTGAWNFQFSPRLRGVVSAERRQYRDITSVTAAGGSVNLRTERDELAEVSLVGRGGWRTLAGLAHSRSRSDDPRSLEASPRVSSVHIGGGYELPSGASLEARVRRGDGDYGGALAGTDFRETEPTLRLYWPATDKTTLDARLGYLDRAHDGAALRDFKGFVGNGTVRWAYSPKTSVEAGAARDLGSYEFAGGGQIRGWRVFIAPAWRPGAMTTLRFRHAYESRDWRVQSPASPDLGREDRIRWNELSLEWTPRRLVQLTASARQERRQSNLPGLDFRSHLVSLTARLNF